MQDGGLFDLVKDIPDPMERLIATGRLISNMELIARLRAHVCTLLHLWKLLAVKQEFWKDGAMAIGI
jgi:hypothetical protein